MHTITVISKPGCHLCERAIQTLESLKARKEGTRDDFELDVINIENNSELYDKYWLKIPVVRLDGKDIFEVEDIALPRDCVEKLEKFVFNLGKS